MALNREQKQKLRNKAEEILKNLGNQFMEQVAEKQPAEDVSDVVLPPELDERLKAQFLSYFEAALMNMIGSSYTLEEAIARAEAVAYVIMQYKTMMESISYLELVHSIESNEV